MPGVHVVPPGEFGEACLSAFAALLEGVPAPVVGLATGNSPIPLYEALHRAVAAGHLSASAMRPFAIDEYVCRREHPCANRAFFARSWEAIPGAAPVAQFDPGVPDLDGEAQRFARALEQAGGLDLALLGIGLNGHLAFNEPGSEVASGPRLVALAPETRASAAACFGEEPPTQGLTLGLRELLGARAVLLLARGAAKAEVVARALTGPITGACPASFLQRHHRLVVVLDTAAAQRLNRPPTEMDDCG